MPRFINDSDCADVCVKNNQACDRKDCRQWLDFEKDLNCTLVAVRKNGNMSLREVAERIGVSFVRVKQIQDKAVEKLTTKNDF
jgi:DNA-directed RNA polymerase sigma subunit (sigma70/sigma32)|tara:strand:+ start:512 stop:760 length:249 start_codon:yes stop_codon:yes gene_type:complete